MGRTVRDTNLESRTARLRLTPRRKPYWRVLEGGLHIGYRRTKEGGGSWVARRFVGDHRYLETKLGTADDLQDADGVALRSFGQAQEAARKWWKAAQRADQGIALDTGPYTVADALRDYFEAREHEGSKGVKGYRQTAAAPILPQLGSIEIEKLTTVTIRAWLAGLAKTDKLVRTKLADTRRATRGFDADDPEAVRARRSTANRILTIFKAALNHAFNTERVSTDQAWRKVKPFREADSAIVRYLTAAEWQRLINACEQTFRDLVRGALLSGCRYGELTRIAAADFNRDAGMITVRLSKAGKARHVVLNDEGRELFEALTAGRAPRELIFKRSDGEPWGPSHQKRPLEEASRRAKIDPAATFHILRHSYASALATRGVPMGVIASQLGHADTRMTEKHYAHLSPSYVADTIRAALPAFGGGGKSNVVAIGG
jgi:integrase